MNRFAYLSTTFALKRLYDFSKARIELHGKANIPRGAIIFVINHFTRIETIFLPYHINLQTKKPVWSLADHNLFKGPLEDFLKKAGAVSTRNPDRDLLIVRSLLTGEADWIIFPEGRMVKSKKIYEDGYYVVSSDKGKHKPHTGAAHLAMRTEFYRQRLRRMINQSPKEARRLLDLFQIESIEDTLARETFIVPVNITYNPLRAKDNALIDLAGFLVDDLPERAVEELMTEGSMLLSGVDIDIRFGKAVAAADYLGGSDIQRDIASSASINFNDTLPSVDNMRRGAGALTNEYMKSIYNMTTVNHDHLFASVIKLMPSDTISPEDLKNRVFLAATLNLDPQQLYLHTSLKRNQINLLTDDRFGRYEDFIAVAKDREVLTEENGMLKRNEEKFLCDPGFHQIRVENPVAVMANEIEPLTPLQDHLKRLAVEPELHIRRRLTSYLIQEAVSRFEDDYDRFHIDGESHDRSVGMPFYIEGESTEKGIVLVHGYMAAPLEVRELAEYLGGLGYWVYVPRLAGHGTAPEDLATRSYLDWLETVESAYVIMKNICDKVVIGGFSTGAGLVLELASRVSDIAGVFAVAPPAKLQDFSSKLVPTVDAWNKIMSIARIDRVKKEFVKNRSENPDINYSRNPVSGIMELDRLMSSVESKLYYIRKPALVVQASRDPVVDPEGSKRVFDLIGSDDKEYFLFNFNRHGILRGEGVQRVFRVIGDFVDRLG